MITKMYLHSCKETNNDKAEELGLNDHASAVFKYALSEVEFDVSIDEDTGHSEILKVDGKLLVDSTIHRKLMRIVLAHSVNNMGGICGQAFTSYTCLCCGGEFSHSNTCTPLICEMCVKAIKEEIKNDFKAVSHD